MKAPNIFKKNLIKLMDKAKMRPVDLARASGLSAQVVNSYLNEGRTPSIEKLDAFAKAFGVKVADLFETNELPEPKIIKPTPQDALAILKDRLLRLEERDQWFMKAIEIAEESHWDGTGPTHEVLAKIYNILMEFMGWPERAETDSEPASNNNKKKASG